MFSGWTQRARRLLAGIDESPEHAMLAVHEAFFAFLLASDPVTARARAVQGAELARRFGLIDLEMQALALEGASLVASSASARACRPCLWFAGGIMRPCSPSKDSGLRPRRSWWAQVSSWR